MLATLPFETLTQDVRLRAVVGGLTEEIIGQLGGLAPERLGVVARTSVMRYEMTRKPIDQIGRELGVHYVLEGTVRASGDPSAPRVRIAARLIQVRDQGQVWSETFEQDASGLFRLEQDSAARIAAGIAGRLFPGATPNNSGLHTHSPQLGKPTAMAGICSTRKRERILSGA